MLFSGKNVIVTGGTRGIGFATVREFLKEGARVALCGTKRETVDRALEKLKSENPDWKVMGLHPDLTDLEEVREAFNGVIERFGPVDVLVNNAGISGRGTFTEYDLGKFQKVVDVNLKSTFNCTRAVVDSMVRRHSGAIVNLSSVVSIYGMAGSVAYPTSKAAVNGLTLSLARELGPMGIRVNAVAPGLIDTDMISVLPDDVRKARERQIPLGRIGKSQDIANAVCFLASDKAEYITGVILSVDGFLMS